MVWLFSMLCSAWGAKYRKLSQIIWLPNKRDRWDHGKWKHCAITSTCTDNGHTEWKNYLLLSNKLLNLFHLESLKISGGKEISNAWIFASTVFRSPMERINKYIQLTLFIDCLGQIPVLLFYLRFLKTIERTLACGDVVLIENLDEKIDPVLDHLLGRNTIKKGK